MKKLYLSLAAGLMFSVGYAQVVKTNGTYKRTVQQGNLIHTVKTDGNLTPINQVIQVPLDSNSPLLNGVVVPTNVNTPVNLNNGTTSNVVNNSNGNQLPPVNNQNNHLHGDHCKSHQLTQQHYEEMGVWEQSYQNYMNVAPTMSSYVPNQNKAAGPNTIPVIFHVVHEGTSHPTNVSYGDIMNMFDDLVEDFQLLNANQSQARSAYGFTPADANIDFCLAQQDPNGLPLAEPGVIRVQTTETWFDPDDNSEVNAMKSLPDGSPIWDRDDYLNVWICDISNGAGFGTAGYAYRPQGGFLPNPNIDGIVVDYNLGLNENVLTHEVGHYLGLMHTWGNSGGCADDDGFSDTPATYGPSFNQGASCSGFQEYCSGIQTQYENYMDYSNCTVMFTQEQVNYMDMILNTYRSSLFLSPGCDPAGPPNCAFSSSPAGPGPITIAQNGTIIFTDESTGGPTSWSWTITPGTQGVDWDFTGGTSATSQNPEVTFYTTDTYNVSMNATNGFGTCSGVTENNYVNVVAPSTGTGCDTLRNYDPADIESLGYYTIPLAGWGSVPGHCYSAPYYHLMYAEKFTATSTAEARRLRFLVHQADDVTGTGAVAFHTFADNAGLPGAVIASDTVSISSFLGGGFWNTLTFTNPASVTGDFWVGYQLVYPTPADTFTLGMGATITGGNASFETLLFDGSAGGWYDYGFSGSIALDVLLSNGPDPIADLQYDTDELCVGGQVAVNGSGSTNTTDYEWWQVELAGPTLIDVENTAGTTFDFNGAPGDYDIVLFADGSCQTDVEFITVTVNAVPTATINVTNTTCGQNNGAISFTGSSGGNGSYEYSIDGGSNFSTTSTYSNLPAGDYDVVIRTGGDNCENTATVTINGSSPVTGTVTPSAVALCEGQSTTLTASGGTNYEWFDGGTSIQNGPSNTLSVTPSATAQYTVEITSGVCSDLQYANVTVNQLDDASFNFADFCLNAPNGATSIATTPGTFAFNPAPGDGASINGTTGEITNETLNTYTVEYTTAGACPNTSTETVVVSNNDDASFTTADYCEGSTHSVTITGTTGGTFSFDGSLPATINTSTGVISNGVAGQTYNIIYTTPAGPCQASSSPVAVTVLTTPTVDPVSNQSICSGDNFTAINFTGTGGGTYTWTNDNTNIGLGVTSTGNIASFAGTTTGASEVANITVTPSVGSCTGASEMFSLTVNLTPTVDAGTDQSVCDGDQVTLTATNPDGAGISWDNSVSDGVAFTPAVGTVTYEVTATLGSCTATDQVDVTVSINPTVDAGMDDTLCANEMLTLTANNPDGGTLSWTNGVTDGVAFSPSVGTLTYTVTSTIGACSSQDQVEITTLASPGVTGTVTDVTTGNDGEIDATISGGNGPIVSTVWDSGQTTEDITGLSAGTYTITVTDSAGCIGTETFTVNDFTGIDDEADKALMIYPNPTNGAFTVMLEGEYELSITDARGRLVLQQTAADQTDFDISDYESGMYFIEIKQEGNTIIRKLIKE